MNIAGLSSSKIRLAQKEQRLRLIKFLGGTSVALLLGILAVGHAAWLNLPPCETEDSPWCVWDAKHQGNGTGTSFISLWEGHYITVN